MGNSGRNVRMSRQQIEKRRKKRLRRKIYNFTIVVVIVLLLLCIINIYARLEKVQTTLKQLDTHQSGALDMKQSEVERTEQKGTGGAVYAHSIVSVEVDKPVERTEEEVIQRLNELGKSNSAIKGICENSSQYPKDLLAALANNPEMADFAAGYSDGNGESTGGLTVAEKEQDFPLFLQWDPRWGYESYGNGSCIGLAGCGPTCLSMALYYLTGDESLTPDAIADYSMKNGYYVDGTGTAWALMEDVPKLYGIGVTKLSAEESNIKATLDNGGVVICSVGRGDFTTSGHYILIYGYDREGFLINDPNCVARSGKRWIFSEIRWQIKNIWAYMPKGQSAATENSVSISTTDGDTVTVLYRDIRESE